MQAKRFDIGSAILFFFTRLGENPGGVIWIAFCQLVLMGGLLVGTLFLLAPAWASLFELIISDSQGQLSDDQALEFLFNVVAPFLGYLALLLPVGILVSLMVQGAWLRFLTRGEIKPVIPFRIGGDEVRLFGVNLMYIVIFVAGYIGVVLAVVTMGVGGAFMAESGGDGAALGTGLLVALGSVAIGVGLLMLAVKLATAPALTVLEGEFRFFESWEASKGVFWQLLVSYLAVYAMMMVLSSVVGVVVQMVLMGVFMPFIEQMVTLEEAGANADPQVVFDMFATFFGSTSNQIFLGIAMLIGYAGQTVAEAMWHSVGAYNAVRNDGDASASLEASKIEAGHPLGASPSEG